MMMQCDALQFHFTEPNDPKKTIVYRFTRALFGLNESPFLLGGTLEHHLSSYESQYPTEIDEIKRSLYVDDIILGGTSLEEVENLKKTAVKIFESGDFHLHKWHSNDPSLELSKPTDLTQEISFAKQQLEVEWGETKLLGIPWNTVTDKLGVTFPPKLEVFTKRKVLSTLAAVYDPLGKMIYRDACNNGTKNFLLS